MTDVKIASVEGSSMFMYMAADCVEWVLENVRNGDSKFEGGKRQLITHLYHAFSHAMHSGEVLRCRRAAAAAAGDDECDDDETACNALHRALVHGDPAARSNVGEAVGMLLFATTLVCIRNDEPVYVLLDPAHAGYSFGAYVMKTLTESQLLRSPRQYYGVRTLGAPCVPRAMLPVATYQYGEAGSVFLPTRAHAKALSAYAKQCCTLVSQHVQDRVRQRVPGAEHMSPQHIASMIGASLQHAASHVSDRLCPIWNYHYGRVFYVAPVMGGAGLPSPAHGKVVGVMVLDFDFQTPSQAQARVCTVITNEMAYMDLSVTHYHLPRWIKRCIEDY